MGRAQRLIILPVVILTMAVAVAVVLITAKQAPDKQPQVKQDLLVETVTVTTTDLHHRVRSQGTVEPKIQTVLSAEVSGRVVAMSEAFVAGGLFSRGDVLIQLEQSDYLTDVKAAEAELARAQAALEEEQARGKVAAEEWRTVRSNVAPELGLRKPQLAREMANLRAAEANLERAQRNLERTVIRAPYDGLVRRKSVDLGQFVTVGSQLGQVFGTALAEVRMPLSDNDLAYLALSPDNSTIFVVSLTAEIAGITHRWRAHLVRTEGVLDPASRMIYAIAEVRDPYLRERRSGGDMQHPTPLTFGRFVRAEIKGDFVRDIAVLPRNVLRIDGSVLVVDAAQRLQIRTVNVQKIDETSVYIDRGLTAGEQVVVSAVPNPVEQMPVRLAATEAADDPAAAAARASL